MKPSAADRAADYATQEAKAIIRYRKASFLRTIAEIARLDRKFAEQVAETVARGGGLSGKEEPSLRAHHFKFQTFVPGLIGNFLFGIL
jgi:hypothetical protein